jgi:hypothetical protein
MFKKPYVICFAKILYVVFISLIIYRFAKYWIILQSDTGLF